MKINIYYGGRGIIDDPSLYAISKMIEVFKELNVETEQFNLYEDKGRIPSLPGTLKDADGVILASTVEWYGVGGLMMQFLDACWLYGDKDKIRSTYMCPVVMSTTYGEREGMTNLAAAWEILGGLPCDGICGYIADTTTLENNADYNKLLEKKAENLYRTINQKTPVLPASNQAVKKMVSITKSADLTPQESEQLSHYVSDDKYVQKQKEDLQELSNLFRNKMKVEEPTDGPAEYLETMKAHFKPAAGMKGRYCITISNLPNQDPMVLKVDGRKCETQLGRSDKEEMDVALTLEREVLEDILAGRMTFQRAFMSGSMKMKGDFKLLRGMDQIFVFMENRP